MTWETYIACVKRLFGRYSRKPPEDADVLQDCWEAIKHVPDEAVDAVLARLCDLEKLPSNWVREFRGAWDCVKEPGQGCESAKPEGCQYCEAGEIYFVHLGRMTVHAAPCGYCRKNAPGALTVTPAHERGLQYIEPYTATDGSRYGQAVATYNWVREQLQASTRKQAA